MQRLFMFFRTALLCVLVAGLCFGQGGSVVDNYVIGPRPNPNAKRYPVAGVVFNTLTNEPVRRALVHLNGPEQHVAFTGADGRFQFENIPEGTIWLSAQRPGYFAPHPNMSSYRVGSGTNEFRLPLTPEAKITGTVSDSEGEPVENIMVQAFGQTASEGRKMWIMRGGTSTDENGAFKLDNQMPGPVVVCTASRPLLPYTAGSTESYPARCYPNAPDRASAQPVEITAGQPARVDFTIDPVRTYTIAGTVTGGLGGVNAWLQGPDDEPIAGQFAFVDPRNGSFVIRSVPNGTWKIHFQSASNRGEMREASEEVNINGADVKGLQVTLAPGAAIPVELTGQESSNSNNRPLPIIRLRRAGNSGTTYASGFTGNQNSAGSSPSLAILNVEPGTYDVTVMSNTACIGAVSSSGVDLLEQPLTVAAGSSPQPITVALRNDCGTIEVTLRSDHPDTPAALLLVPEAPGIEPQMITFTGASYTFSQLTPGSYHIYAVSNAEGLEYANPDAMRNIPGQTVMLDANQKASVTVSVYQRGER